jgi:uncharacterized protein involved in exopolysaccharide biosynthesis
LTQLLATRSFLRSVAEDSPLAESLENLAPLEAERQLVAMGGTITVATPGPQLLVISTKQDNPELAKGLAAAVIRQFSLSQTELVRSRAREQADYDKKRLDEASASLKDAEAKVAEYMKVKAAANPDDPTMSALIAAAGSAQQQYADAANAYSLSSAALTAANSTGLEVIDEPDTAQRQGRLKSVAMGAIGGLVAGLTVSVLGLIALMHLSNRPPGEESFDTGDREPDDVMNISDDDAYEADEGERNLVAASPAVR